MRLSFNILFIGFLLAGQWQISEGQSYPAPSISVAPTNVVSLGENIILRCASMYHQLALYYLYKNGSLHLDSVFRKPEKKALAFLIPNARGSDGGTYTCLYCFPKDIDKRCSYHSHPVQIYIKESNLPKPSIKVLPDEQISLGQNITIECQGPEEALNFSLYKSGKLITSQMTESIRAKFPFFNVGLEDEGNYTCQYRRKENPYAWSETSNPKELVVRDMAQQSKIIIWASIAAGLLLFLFLLLFIFVLYRKRRKGSIPNETPQAMNMTPELDREADTDEISYAVLNHNSPRTKRAALPATVSHPCVYATLQHDKVRDGQ